MGRRNGIALALTILLHLIVVLLIIYIRGPAPPRKEERSLLGFAIPAPPSARKEKEKSEASEEKKQVTKKEPVKPVPLPYVPPPPLIPGKVPTPPQSAFIEISKADFAASDISRIGKSGGGTGDSKAVQGPGEGPGGATLYDADWARRPTNAELAGYLPARAPSKGWGLVACRTAPGNRVENCQSMGESPLGSGFARAVREAAWQFRVLPPRINGQPVIGAWVRIRITYGVEAEPEG